MSAWVAETGAWLLQAAATLPDTIVTKQVETDPGWFSKFTSIASGIMTVSLTVLTIFLVPAAWRFRHTHKKISELLDKVYGDVYPLVRHASAIADNVDYITTSVRVDIQQVNQTIATANERLLRAVETAEARMTEFNALLGVVQEEAEDVFVSTASTLRGVRAGAASFGRQARKRELAASFDDGLTGEELDTESDELLADTTEHDISAFDDPLDDPLIDDLVSDDDELAGAADEELDDLAGSGPIETTGTASHPFDDGELFDGYDRGHPADGWSDEKPRIRPRRAPRERFDV